MVSSTRFQTGLTRPSGSHLTALWVPAHGLHGHQHGLGRGGRVERHGPTRRDGVHRVRERRKTEIPNISGGSPTALER